MVLLLGTWQASVGGPAVYVDLSRVCDIVRTFGQRNSCNVVQNRGGASGQEEEEECHQPKQAKQNRPDDARQSSAREPRPRDLIVQTKLIRSNTHRFEQAKGITSQQRADRLVGIKTRRRRTGGATPPSLAVYWLAGHWVWAGWLAGWIRRPLPNRTSATGPPPDNVRRHRGVGSLPPKPGVSAGGEERNLLLCFARQGKRRAGGGRLHDARCSHVHHPGFGGRITSPHAPEL